MIEDINYLLEVLTLNSIISGLSRDILLKRVKLLDSIISLIILKGILLLVLRPSSL